MTPSEFAMSSPDAARLLPLLYAGVGSAVCRLPDGRLEVRTAGRLEGTTVLTQEQALNGHHGLDTLFALVA
ncbi:hypothetical protein ACWFMI_23035 [Nocardiopsis terrae]|uniref:hypothetical protein n=1 Tax=Streptomyces sp. NPDC057554 TaxID=3350538 RepID=UPI0036A84D11